MRTTCDSPAVSALFTARDFGNRMSYFTASLPMTPLWFNGWQPKSAGTTFAACLGLFGLAILHKLLGALKHQANLAWSKAAHRKKPRSHLAGDDKSDTITGSLSKSAHHAVPWIPEHEIPRGILAAIHYGIGSFLMLAVMTYNAYFFIAIILGVFAGEVAFGRWTASSRGH
ncbi:uncharacterized protein MELLADRAFT_115525 [Melampsora larici-populina 98AG31]|uniref:Copper transport protein n=1 Tax=Melampsora larici-populina (strain 98AG31 / pathotype 3-4-7) TaxID=747676 RepID=F4RBB2_MELLP|nr:uncharacterized protein MELLADRAFT_115525 [Melampsora larici-populina 98AG31]EGG10054.1 hypothetical protein MELLADRAFT_115525 [Melampsora larici-populina 98AG31]